MKTKFQPGCEVVYIGEGFAVDLGRQGYTFDVNIKQGAYGRIVRTSFDSPACGKWYVVEFPVGEFITFDLDVEQKYLRRMKR